MSEHPEYTEWTASRGRLIAYDTCVDELREVYGSIPGRGEHERTLETAMRHAVAHLTQTSSLAGRRLPRSAGLLKRLGMAAGSNPHGGDEVHRFFSATRELEKLFVKFVVPSARRAADRDAAWRRACARPS